MTSEFEYITCLHCGAVNRMPHEKLSKHPKCGSCHQLLFVGKPFELTGELFLKVIGKTSIPIVVDFWAPWCGPCNTMAPIFEQAAKNIEPKARLVKLNTEVAQDIAATYNIRSIPTLVIFKNGKEVSRQSGAMDKGNLIRFVETNL